ncbi:MAG: hypothetical protein JWP91_2494 [Fibrobacteres bacterium]|nr:hypothetical protein [Fibrobacterota bacterium]
MGLKIICRMSMVSSFLFLADCSRVINERNAQKPLSSTRYYANGMKSEYVEFKISDGPGKTAPDTVYSGSIIKWDTLGNMIFRRRYLNGRLEGDSEEWFPNGVRRVLQTFHQDKSDSSVYWYANGVLSKRIRPGKDRDTMYVYDESGRLQGVEVLENVE